MGGVDSSLCSHPAHSGSGCDSMTLALDVARERTVVCLSGRGHITKCQSWWAPKTFLCSRLPVSNEDTRDHSRARFGDIHSPAPCKLQGSAGPGTPTPCRRMGSACFLPAPHLLIPARRGSKEEAPLRIEPIPGKAAGEASLQEHGTGCLPDLSVSSPLHRGQ